VAAFSGVVAEQESAARSAADYAARKQREVDEAEKADLPAGVSISDMVEGACARHGCSMFCSRGHLA
jgi:hypothetical protein